MEEGKHSAELKRNHCTTNVIGEELKWRKASYFCAQNRWKCEEEFFFFKKLYFKVVKDFPLKKNIEENFHTAMGEKKKVTYDHAAKELTSKSETRHNDKWKEVKPPNAMTILSSVLDRCLMYCISL